MFKQNDKNPVIREYYGIFLYSMNGKDGFKTYSSLRSAAPTRELLLFLVRFADLGKLVVAAMLDFIGHGMNFACSGERLTREQRADQFVN